ncbi:MAG: hypothetical protein KAS99_05570 [Candidatus Omnitrophica bacterium]|nr:hypothetical protein [Candidatus Omnitrophota bacterium]
MIPKQRKLFLKIIILLALIFPAFAQGSSSVNSIFIPTWQGFDFAKAKIVDREEGDIVILPGGIETSSLQVEIAALEKGFIEDIKNLPEEEVINWTNFEEYVIDMLYAVRTGNKKYALFELIDVKVSDDEIIGIEIEYKYQPNGSKEFD